jgi:hypothetical protein
MHLMLLDIELNRLLIMKSTPYKNFYAADHGESIKGYKSGLSATPWLLSHGLTQLFKSNIHIKTAMIMILMCVPTLLFTAILTLPGLIFQSPEQHAYYYFSHVINNDPTRWVILTMNAICVILSLAMPAMEHQPQKITAR